MAIALRHRAAVAALGLRGRERVLEIGCGSGVATSLLLEALPEGQVVALDRSAKMIEALRQKQETALSQGRLETRAEAIETASLAAHAFDAVAAINVDFNLRLGARWPPLIERLLSPEGLLVLAFEAPPGSAKGGDFVRRSSELLKEAGFSVREDAAEEGAVRVALILARPPAG